MLRLDGAIQQRMIGVVQQHLPVLGADAAGKQVWIERGTAHHGQHFAGSGVQSHHRATAVFHGQLSHRLQIQVDGQLQVLAGNGFLVIQDVALVPEAVHFHAPLPVDAHQLVVVLAFDTVLADHVALMEAGKFGRVQLGFTHLSDVSDDMRRQAVAGIQTVLDVNHLELGERTGILMRIDKRQLARSQLFLDRDRLVLRGAARLKSPDAGHQAVIIEIQTFRDGPQMLHLQVFTR